MRRDGLVIVFNGEIYNYRELREDLRARGYTFTTNGDTEVILRGWQCWGKGVLRRLRGMFAFAIYDLRTEELFLARDHFGIKPLYFVYDEAVGRLAFASELRAIADLAPGGGRLSGAGLCASLLYVWLPDSVSIFEGVKKVQPGELVRYHPARGVERGAYWKPAELLDQEANGTSEDLAEALRGSVEAHLVADVPVAAFLSGGLDSSLVCAVAAAEGRPLRCFSIGFASRDKLAENMPDDLLYARYVAGKLGLVLEEIEASPDVVDSTLRLARVLDEPIGDSAALHTLSMCEAASDHGIKVLLSGMGADEMLGGYRRHKSALLAGHYRRLPSGLRGLTDWSIGKLPVTLGNRGLRHVRWAKRFLSFATTNEADAYLGSYTYFGLDALDALTKRQFSPEIDDLAEEHAQRYALAGGDASKGAQIRRMCTTDLQMFLPGLNLAYTDRASMAASTEVRVPFVDIKVVEAVYRLDPATFIRGNVQKAPLKQVAERYLPNKIVYRPKASFGSPLRSWTRGSLKPLINDLLPDGLLVTGGYLDRGRLIELIRQNERGVVDHAQIIWHLLTLETWMRGLKHGSA